ncbi:MAG TPA: nuclear transport factor 2 family protein [Candidatus Limnocylindrales bacterium]|nr:nuclear transport factor 2 family protein [Candidatus Limnocylindrales bacterium]
MTVLEEAWIAPASRAASLEVLSAIETCVRDYYEGWYTADGGRMARAVHPALAKRSFAQDRDRRPTVDETTADEMIAGAAAGLGRTRAGTKLDIRVAEVGAGIASVNVFADHYVDLLHLIETPDGWRIINALWRWADGHGPRA